MELKVLISFIFLEFSYVIAQYGVMDRELEYYCGNKPADIVFLLDASNSIWTPDLRRQINFVENITSMFEIGKNTTRVGVGSYSTWVNTEINLNDYYDKEELLAAIRDLRPRRGFLTSTAAALRHMRTRMFKHKHGGRNDPSVAKVAILLTDGKSTQRMKTVFEALRVKRQNIHAFSIGIGSKTNPSELKMIASPPFTQNYFHVNNFAALDSIRKELAVRTCKVAPPKTTTTTTTTTTTPTTTTTTPTTTTTSLLDVARRVCEMARVDVVFAFDSSSAVSTPDFYRQLNFAKDVISNFNLGPDMTRVSAILYSDQILNIFDLNEYYNAEKISNVLSQVQRSAGGSRIDEALWYIRTKTFRRSVARREVAQIVILMTGRESIYKERTKKQATKTRDSGIKVIPIAVGRGYDVEEIRAIAGPGPDALLHELSSFDGLQNILAENTLEICSAPQAKLSIADQSCGSRQAADLIFLLDSLNAGRKNSRKTVEFLNKLFNEFDIGHDKIRVGLMSAECLEHNMGFQLNKYSNRTSLKEGLNGLEATDFSTILREMRRNAFSVERGGRKGAKKMAVMIIDGNLEEPTRTLKEAQRAKTHGIELYVVHVGNEDPQEEVVLMADEPSKQSFFHVPDYDQLALLWEKLIDVLCDEL